MIVAEVGSSQPCLRYDASQWVQLKAHFTSLLTYFPIYDRAMGWARRTPTVLLHTFNELLAVGHPERSPKERFCRIQTRCQHNMKYRTTLLFLCALGVFLSWLLPTIVRAIHDAHGMATAHEFQALQLIDVDRLEAIKTEYSMPEYSVEQRVRAVGGIQFYLPIVTYMLATLFGMIGVLVWMSDSVSASN